MLTTAYKNQKNTIKSYLLFLKTILETEVTLN